MKKFVLDLILFVGFLLILDYRATQNMGHEVGAFVFFALCVVHHVWDRAWHKGLGRGRWNAQRTWGLIVNAVLGLSLVAVMVSGVMMSHQLYMRGIQFPRLPMNPRLHFFCAYVMLIALGLHVGAHWEMIRNRFYRHISQLPVYKVFSTFLMVIFLIGGIYFSFEYRVGDRLLFTNMRGIMATHEPVMYFIGHFYILIMWAILGNFVYQKLKPKPRSAGGKVRAGARR